MATGTLLPAPSTARLGRGPLLVSCRCLSRQELNSVTVSLLVGTLVAQSPAQVTTDRWRGCSIHSSVALGLGLPVCGSGTRQWCSTFGEQVCG